MSRRVLAAFMAAFVFTTDAQGDEGSMHTNQHLL